MGVFFSSCALVISKEKLWRHYNSSGVLDNVEPVKYSLKILIAIREALD